MHIYIIKHKDRPKAHFIYICQIQKFNALSMIITFFQELVELFKILQIENLATNTIKKTYESQIKKLLKTIGPRETV